MKNYNNFNPGNITSLRKPRKIEKLKYINSKFDVFLLLITLVCWIFIGYSILKIGLIPMIMRLTIVSFITTFNFLFVYFDMGRKKKINKTIIKFILIIILISEVLVTFRVNAIVNSVLSFSEQPTKFTTFVSEKSSNIEKISKIEELVSYRIGYLNNEKEYLRYQLPLESFKTSGIIDKMNLIPFESDVMLLEALEKKEVDLIIDDQDYKSRMINLDFKVLSENSFLNFQINSTKEIDTGDALNVSKPFSILFSGVDTVVEGSVYGYSDAIIMATINPNRKKIVLTSIPRDTYMYITCLDKMDKITHASYKGDAKCLNDSLSLFLDVKIDKYIMTNFKGFVDIINAVGGVSVTVDPVLYPNGFKVDNSHREGSITVPPGTTIASGEVALAYARARHEVRGGSTERGTNQLYVIEALMMKIARTRDVNNVLNIINIISGNSETNLTSSDMSSLSQFGFSMISDPPSVLKQTLITNGDIIDDVWVEHPDEVSFNNLQYEVKVTSELVDPKLPTKIEKR